MTSAGQCVSYEERGGVVILRLGGGTKEQPVDKVPVLNEERMVLLEKTLGEIEKKSNVRGVVIIGSNGGAFCAGADINALQAIKDAKAGAKLAERGQQLFRRIELLPYPTVAAISGPCVGGGCELVLACNYRVAVNNSSTKIGLPEINLGILPGFGGTQRLPRLIGLPAALDIILAGKVIAAKQAQKIGLVDVLINEGSASFEALEKAALQIASGESKPETRALSAKDKLLTYFGLGRSLVAKQSRKQIYKATKGQYPAPLRALDICLEGLKLGTEVGYPLEAQALGDLAATAESKSLIHIFFLTEAAKKIGRGVKDLRKDMSVAVVGGGVMGRGIAGTLLHKGVRVAVVDPAAEARDGARKHIVESVQTRRSLSDKQKEEMIAHLSLVADLSEVREPTVIIEAATENAAIKRKIFAAAEAAGTSETVIATNTSSIPITELATGMNTPERFIGMHFFNPVEKMPLVEIIRGAQTSERTMVATAALTSKLGKHPVVVEDVSGFLVNRTLTPYLVEAAILLSEGYSEVDIDKSATAFGMPMGPIRLLDEVGLDVVSKVSQIIEDAYGERMKGPKYAETLVGKGRLGRKSGNGFYRYEGKEHKKDDGLRELLNLPEGADLVVADSKFISERLIFRLINEAVLCLDEGVAGAPGSEAAGQIDLASVMGIGFPPFRGGIIHYAESLGAKAVFTTLSTLADNYGARFAPSPGIRKRAEKGQSFYTACT